jgi:3-methyladenine DNA glycosylase AlkD
MEIKGERQTPRQVATRIIASLRKKADPEKAKQGQRYFKEQVKLFGLSAKDSDLLVKELYRSQKPYWNVNDVIKLCDILLPNPYLEAKGSAIGLLAAYKKDFEKELFKKIEKWLSSNYCDSWAAVDGLCLYVLGELISKYPELKEKIKDWPHSSNRWIRRAAAVSFIKIARRGETLDDVYEISKSLFSDDNDLVQKANGWLLREAGKADPSRLESYLLKHGKAIPRITLRYAIERFEEKKRKHILVVTRENTG